MRTTHFLSATIVLVLAGCGGKDDPKASGGGSSGGEAETAGEGETAGETGATPTTGGESGETGIGGPGETGMGILVPDDTPSSTKECDVFAQDCPDGEKCMPYANDGGSSWNAAKCSPLDAMPKQQGDPCHAEGNGVAGLDNCDISLICWFLNLDNDGVCTDQCGGTIDSPTCPDLQQVCDISNDGVIAICLDTCNPLTQDCPPEQICFNSGSVNFVCDMDASGDGGQYQDPCVYINECDYGLYCASQAGVPGCQNPDGCCAPYCSLSAPDCPMDTECQPWYGMDQAPPGQEDIGFCEIPM